MSKHTNNVDHNLFSKNALIRWVLRTDNDMVPLILRITTGMTFAAHGAQKLFGVLGGYGLEGTGQWMESVGLSPGYLMALLVGSAEFFGGLALIFGLLVRPSALVLAVTMLVAIVTVHLDKGFFMANNGYEFALALLTMCVALALSGGGRFSLDGVLSTKCAS